MGRGLKVAEKGGSDRRRVKSVMCQDRRDWEEEQKEVTGQIGEIGKRILWQKEVTGRLLQARLRRGDG